MRFNKTYLKLATSELRKIGLMQKVILISRLDLTCAFLYFILTRQPHGCKKTFPCGSGMENILGL